MELFVNADHYCNIFDQFRVAQPETEQFETKASFFKVILSFQFVDEAEKSTSYQDAFRREALYNCKLKTWSSVVCVAALSSVVRQSIKLVYTPP